jgi:prevent-host-death family protein
MKVIEVGAFEAKTHLSHLLDEVEKGATVRILRRGKLVAVLQSSPAAARETALHALDGLRTMVSTRMPLSEVLELRDVGRER